MSGQDFTVAFTAGVTNTTWLDPLLPPNPEFGEPGHNPALPVGPGTPSRLNAHVGFPHRRYVGAVGAQIEITATVGGVAGPLDAALGGRLFTLVWAVEHPQPGPVGFTHPAGQSSVQHFTPTTAGHYTIGIERAGGGKVFMHLDVEAP